ncbi:hypothetical protein BS78_08G098600 [Paspalum vaginatum]|nr:hypothetical protein BS78_08G098600 [Paspalum vaginatum]
MDAQSSASASVLRNGGDLPLITCTDCPRAKMVKRRSTKEWSLGKIFYCFVHHNGRCPFFYWEDEYLDWLLQLKSEGKLAPEYDIFDGFDDFKEGRAEQPKRKDLLGSLDEKELEMMLRLVSGLGNELVRLLKAVLFVSVCILLLQLVSLVAHMSNHEI